MGKTENITYRGFELRVDITEIYIKIKVVGEEEVLYSENSFYNEVFNLYKEVELDYEYIVKHNVSLDVVASEMADKIREKQEKIMEKTYNKVLDDIKMQIDKLYNTVSKDYKELADNIYEYSVYEYDVGSWISPKILEILVNNLEYVKK